LQQLWVLKSKGPKSTFGGNDGYPDDPEAFYVYDNLVKHYDKLKAGDSVIIADRDWVLGFSRVSSIDIQSGVKKARYKCPICGIYEFYSRVNISPKYKCRKKHEFDKPLREVIQVTKYTAHYKDGFVRPVSEIPVISFTDHYINYNRYYSIQQIDMEFMKGISNSLFKILKGFRVEASDPYYLVKDFNNPPYNPSGLDRRNYRNIRTPDRKGQKAFKTKLIKAYEHRCMLSECDVATTLQASHICPYRGVEDHHPANGLLLRNDLHVLFDANLLGIHPRTLKVQLHPSIAHSSYAKFKGKKLRVGVNVFPERKALEYRFEIFIKNLTNQPS